MNICHLTVLGSLVFSGLLSLGACGSSSSSGLGGTTGSLGGTTGSLGGTTGSAGGQVGAAGGSTGTGSCSTLPSCVQPLLSCAGGGTCVTQRTQVNSEEYGFSTCYSNGAKEIFNSSTNVSTGTITSYATWSKSGAVCFTEVAMWTVGTAGANPPIIKNASGTTVGTVTPSADGRSTWIVTCAGEAPVTVPNDCIPADTTSADCTDGVCQ